MATSIIESEIKSLGLLLECRDPSLLTDEFQRKVPKLLEILGFESPIVRDTIGWMTLSSFFRSHYPTPQLRLEILKLLSSPKHLFLNIGQGETTDTLMRSFSVLTIADVIAGDAKFQKSFTAKQLNDLSSLLRNYISTEMDFRGFDENVGWVHAIAHLGDTYFELAKHPHTSQEALEANAFAILKHIEYRGSDVFKWGEDYRLGRALVNCLERISPSSIEDLLKTYTKVFLFESPALQNLTSCFRVAYLELIFENSQNQILLERFRFLLETLR